MKLVHGGDIFGYEQEFGKQPLDFSANINPLGMPEGVRKAIMEAAGRAEQYPDPLCRRLVRAIHEKEQIPEAMLLCGNGAADLIFRFVLAVKPKKAILLAPTFAEYEQALQTVDCTICYYGLQEKKEFQLDEGILAFLNTSADILFLCNPNNPTGQIIEKPLLEKILNQCRKQNILLVLDECFVDFLEEPENNTMKSLLPEYTNLVILRAFTKLYSMAGVRLGYCMSGNRALLESARRCGQPWAVSSLAQEAGIAALQETAYVEETKKVIREERQYLKDRMQALGCRVIGSHGNYIFFQTAKPGFENAMKQHGILIRSCSNYRGLSDQYYRIAVRLHEENKKLLEAAEKVLSE